jgi:peptide/nickel transport system permease protein
VLCFPVLFLIITIMAYFPPSIFAVMLVIGFTGWPRIARLVRAEFLRLGGNDFVVAARALGMRPSRVIFRHILPNAMAPVLVAAAFGVAGAILTESALSYLGIGVPPGTPSWGTLLKSAQRSPQDYWWLTLFPGFAIFIAVTAYNVLAEGLRDATDPRLRT